MGWVSRRRGPGGGGVLMNRLPSSNREDGRIKGYDDYAIYREQDICYNILRK